MMGNVEVIFLGTGASIESPAIQCLLREDGCLGCKTALSTAPKNKRRQSSILVRIKQDDDSLKNILVDCGGTTYAAMMEIFPKHGVDRIDAVLFTHSHADAIGGCDALRCEVASDQSFSLHFTKQYLQTFAPNRFCKKA